MIKGILFDKDGTLIDYSMWKNAGINLIKVVMNENGITDEKIYKQLLKSIGIYENGVDPFGALAYKSHEEVAKELHFVLSKQNVEINYDLFIDHVTEFLRKEVLRDDVELKPITNLNLLLDSLKQRGMKIGLVTSDSLQSATHFINKFNLNDSFDFIGAKDGVFKLKPHFDMCEKFLNDYGLKPCEVAVVGDSYSDMLFAKNSGALAIGVLSGVSSKINLKDMADIIIPSVESFYSEEFLLSLEEYKCEGSELCTA